MAKCMMILFSFIMITTLHDAVAPRKKTAQDADANPLPVLSTPHPEEWIPNLLTELDQLIPGKGMHDKYVNCLKSPNSNMDQAVKEALKQVSDDLFNRRTEINDVETCNQIRNKITEYIQRYTSCVRHNSEIFGFASFSDMNDAVQQAAKRAKTRARRETSTSSGTGGPASRTHSSTRRSDGPYNRPE